jgi:hypothetical protein
MLSKREAQSRAKSACNHALRLSALESHGRHSADAQHSRLPFQPAIKAGPRAVGIPGILLAAATKALIVKAPIAKEATGKNLVGGLQIF